MLEIRAIEEKQIKNVKHWLKELDTYCTMNPLKLVDSIDFIYMYKKKLLWWHFRHKRKKKKKKKEGKETDIKISWRRWWITSNSSFSFITRLSSCFNSDCELRRDFTSLTRSFTSAFDFTSNSSWFLCKLASCSLATPNSCSNVLFSFMINNFADSTRAFSSWNILTLIN